jgi:hypothetical protein
MGKKQKKAIGDHQKHHQMIQDYIIGQMPLDQHVMPRSQPWHSNEPWCWCRPIRGPEHPVNGRVIWVHNHTIH